MRPDRWVGVRPDPILICGSPRSGTSITAAIFAKCGLWLGNVGKGTKDNQRGFFENGRIRSANKNVLRGGGYDPAGVNPLPPHEWIGDHKLLRGQVERVLADQSCPKNQRWGFKDPKLLLTWRTWLEAFPFARFVVTMRDPLSIERSCRRASFFRHRTEVDWPHWVEDQLRRIAHLESVRELNVNRVWPGRLSIPDGWMQYRLVVQQMGLEWKIGAQEFFDPKLWNRE